MKKLFLTLLIVPFLTKGQQATIHFDIKNSTAENIKISFFDDYTNPKVLFEKKNWVDIPLTNGEADWTYQLSQPVYIGVYYQNDSKEKWFDYSFYLSPKDELQFSIDENNLRTSIVVRGKGSQNNQPLIQQIHDDFLQTLYATYKQDTLPNHVFKAIKNKNELNRKTLKGYIAKYHPTKDFVKKETMYIQYFPIMRYSSFKGNQKFNVREAYYRNKNKWESIADSLIKVNPINNDEALNVSGYSYFLSNFLLRTKERLWDDDELLKKYIATNNHSESLITEPIPTDIAQMYEDDPENLLREKIIEKHFTGKIAEFLYVIIFQESISENEDNLPEIFTRFKQKYPKSQYISYIEPAVVKIEENRNRKITDKMKFENTESFQTFEDVLKLVKGKTVLLDMWGTWCGPCREEISLNSDSIKHHFKDKALNFLYIANRDIGKETKWRELIAYYNLTGTHILASLNLTKDIMTKVNGDGFPTYVIIKKDGTFELSETGYPMKREILIKQLERALTD